MEVREASAAYAVLTAAIDDVPIGYKRTDAGVIPEDWGCPSVGQLASNRSNAIVGGPFGSDLVSKDYVAAGVPVVRGQNMAHTFVSGDFVFVSRQKAKLLQANTARAGDIIFTQRGTLGQVAIVPSQPYSEYIVSQSQMKLTLNVVATSPEYVQQYFVSNQGQRQILESAIQTGVPHTNLGILRRYKVPVPPTRAEQKAIADALSDADALIESLQQLLAKKRQIKQGAMQALLTGKRRLPGFSGEWEIRRIAEVAQVKTGPFGSTLHESDYVQVGTPIITVEHLGEFGVTRQNLPLVSDDDRKRLQAYSLEVGDIVFSRVGSVDRNALIREDESGWLFSGRLLRVRPDRTKAFPPFVSYQFHAVHFRNSVLAVAVGQTMASLNTKILNNLTVALPPILEQTAIATILSDMDTELAALGARLTKARQLKQGMMQVLLTGKIRLPLAAA